MTSTEVGVNRIGRGWSGMVPLWLPALCDCHPEEPMKSYSQEFVSHIPKDDELNIHIHVSACTHSTTEHQGGANLIDHCGSPILLCNSNSVCVIQRC